MTLTLQVSQAVVRRMTEDPEALRRAAAIIEAAFGESTNDSGERESLLVSDELYGSFLDIIDGVEAETIKTKPFDVEASLVRAKELLHPVAL